MVADHLVRPQYLRAGGCRPVRCVRRVDAGRHLRRLMQADPASRQRRYAVARRFQPGVEKVHHLGPQCSQRAAQRRAFRNDIVRRARLQRADRNQPAVGRIQVAADDRADLDGEPRGRLHGIDGLEEGRAMPADTFDLDVPDDIAVERRPGPHRRDARVQQRHIVEGIDLVEGEALQQSVGDHRPRAQAIFLGRLEYQHDSPGGGRMIGQMARGAQQRRAMAVMAAGMGDAGAVAVPGLARRIVHRQRVHVRAQRDRRTRLAAVDHGDDSRAADPGRRVQPEFAQPVGDDRGGPRFVERQFRVAMEVPPPLGHGRRQPLHLFHRLHRLFLPAVAHPPASRRAVKRACP